MKNSVQTFPNLHRNEINLINFTSDVFYKIDIKFSHRMVGKLRKFNKFTWTIIGYKIPTMDMEKEEKF